MHRATTISTQTSVVLPIIVVVAVVVDNAS